ncbi:peptidoglycan-binding domain-containing protein [Clostridium botulinum]|uniref:peptidoglycan-binding domain-containing protein n=1 Tax=Clostridium botulinum TaxID=1491 RepID=UPI002F2B767B
MQEKWIFNAKNYTVQANALLRAGYATSPNYARQLIQLIEQYNLSKYDNCSGSNTYTSSSNTPLWKLCINGDAVRRLQHELNVQYVANIKEDGWFGDATLNKCCTVRQGARGNISKIIQERLIDKVYSVGKWGADGCFGSGTYDAVIKLQKNNSLSADGIVGKDIWKALFRK